MYRVDCQAQQENSTSQFLNKISYNGTKNKNQELTVLYWLVNKSVHHCILLLVEFMFPFSKTNAYLHYDGKIVQRCGSCRVENCKMY